MSLSPPALRRRFLLTCSLASTLGLQACGTLRMPAPPPPLTVAVPPELAQHCPRADYAQVKTVGDLATFGIQDDADLAICDARRAAAVSIIEAMNNAQATLHKALAPRPWWKLWQ